MDVEKIVTNGVFVAEDRHFCNLKESISYARYRHRSRETYVNFNLELLNNYKLPKEQEEEFELYSKGQEDIKKYLYLYLFNFFNNNLIGKEIKIFKKPEEDKLITYFYFKEKYVEFFKIIGFFDIIKHRDLYYCKMYPINLGKKNVYILEMSIAFVVWLLTEINYSKDSC